MDTSQETYRIPRTQSTELKKVNKQKGPNEDDLIPLRREKKEITGGRQREGPGWERGQGGEVGNMIWYWGEKD